MDMKILKGNMFLIEFKSECDYNFVIRGWPWLHKGNALLVAPYDGTSCPSDVKLDAVPVWVQIFNLPMAMMTVQ